MFDTFRHYFSVLPCRCFAADTSPLSPLFSFRRFSPPRLHFTIIFVYDDVIDFSCRLMDAVLPKRHYASLDIFR